MLVFLPGGPGAGIAMIFGEYGKAQHLDEVRREYDVVTYDPRGIGQSNPIRCAPDAVPSPQPPADRALTADEFERIREANAAFFKSCSSLTGDLFSRLAASDTAADIEQIRLALTPNDGLVAYGGSYGSATGQAYLERYGDRVKAMVLDAVLDHSIDLATLSARNVSSVNDSFGRFLQWCRGNASCALHNQDAGAVYDAVAAKAPQARVVVSQLLSAGNEPDVGWPAIAKMVAGARRGDVAALESLTATASLAGSSQDADVRAGKNGLFPGVMCADYGPQNDYNALVTAAASVTAEAPRFIWKYWDAYPVAHASLGVPDCAGWPWPARYPPHKLEIGPHPNVMVANPTHDPATPLANAVSVWLQIPQSRLLIADVDGHQSWILSSCAFHAELRFLENPKSAQSTTLCPR